MLVYRLEDKRGYGPFSYHNDWPKNLDGDKALHNQHGCTVTGTYRWDSDERKKYRFGCRSMAQLEKYWGNELDKQTKEGWVIAVYKVRKNYVLMSTIDIELAFKIEKAVKI